MQFPTYPAKRRNDHAMETAVIESTGQLKQVTSGTSNLRDGAMFGNCGTDTTVSALGNNTGLRNKLDSLAWELQ